MKKISGKEASPLGRILSFALCGVLTVIFAFSIFLSCTENLYEDSLSALKVVKTSSMERRNPLNEYLEANDLDNQIGTFDLIVTHPLPAEMELELYDIVVYEVDGALIIHRIVGIEEPNEKHPGIRHFKLQGDSISAPDRYPVLYEQMRAIYRDERVPFVGSFIAFLQSPAGWLCILLAFFTIIITPIAEKKLATAILERYEILLAAPVSEEAPQEEKTVEPEQPKVESAPPKAPPKPIPENLSVKLTVRYPAAHGRLGTVVSKYVDMNLTGKDDTCS